MPFPAHRPPFRYARVDGLPPPAAHDHPFFYMLCMREPFRLDEVLEILKTGTSYAPPEDYGLPLAIAEPSDEPKLYTDAIRLEDVMAFREETARKAEMETTELRRFSAEDRRTIRKAMKESRQMARETCIQTQTIPSSDEESSEDEGVEQDEEEEDENDPPTTVTVEVAKIPKGVTYEFEQRRYMFAGDSELAAYSSADPTLVKELIDLYDEVTAGNITYTPELHWRMEALRDLVKPRQVLYRATTNPNNGTPLLEACHFEVFLPDRPDLRFIDFPRSFRLNKDETLRSDQLFLISAADISRHCGKDAPVPAVTVDDGSLRYPVEWGLNERRGAAVAEEEQKQCRISLQRYIKDKELAKSPSPPTHYVLVDGWSFPVNYVGYCKCKLGQSGLPSCRCGSVLGPWTPEKKALEDKRCGVPLKAKVHVRESAWLRPVEHIGEARIEAYTRVTRLVRSSSTAHRVYIDETSITKAAAESNEINVNSPASLTAFEQRMARNLIVNAAVKMRCEDEQNYRETSGVLLSVDPIVIRSRTFYEYFTYATISLPPWITALKIPLFVQDHKKIADGEYEYAIKGNAVLEKLWRGLKWASSGIPIRIIFSHTPLPIERAVLANREEHLSAAGKVHTFFINQGLEQRSKDSIVAIFGEVKSEKLRSYLKQIDDSQFKVPRAPPLSEKGKQLMENMLAMPQVRTAIVSSEPMLLLAKEGGGKTCAAVAIALSKPLSQTKLLVGYTRMDCRAIVKALAEMSASYGHLKTDHDDYVEMENEDAQLEFFQWASIDIVITTAHSLMMRLYHKDLLLGTQVFNHHRLIIIDNVEVIPHEILYLLLKQCPHDQLIMTANQFNSIDMLSTRGPQTNVLSTMHRKKNIYTAQIVRNPRPADRLVTEFFYPVSKFGSHESFTRFCTDIEFPAYCDVLKILRDARLPDDGLQTVAASKKHAELINAILASHKHARDPCTYPEAFEGIVAPVVILLGGRRTEQIWSNRKFRSCFEHSHLDVLIAIGTSNPFGFALLKDENDLAHLSEDFKKKMARMIGRT